MAKGRPHKKKPQTNQPTPKQSKQPTQNTSIFTFHNYVTN